MERARGPHRPAPQALEKRRAAYLPLTRAPAEIIELRWQARTLTRPDGGTVLADLVFNRAARPVGSFRKAWAKACTAAGVPGLLFHDPRRSAVRNFERASVSRSVAVAMKLTWHKTESVYRRCAIVAETDLRDALTKTEAAVSADRAATVMLLARRAGKAQA